MGRCDHTPRSRRGGRAAARVLLALFTVALVLLGGGAAPVAAESVIATVQVGSSPNGVAMHPDGTRAYVVNTFDDTVSVIDTATNTVVNPAITVGDYPVAIAVRPDGARAYVAGGSFAGYVNVIDLTTNQVVGQPIDVGFSPTAIAVRPDGARAYVTNCNSGNVSVIDTATDTVISTITVGNCPGGIATHSTLARAYVANTASNTVSVINTDTNTVVGPAITVGGEPTSVAVRPDGARVYISNSASNTVSVLNTTTDQVVATIGVGNSPVGVAFRPDGVRAYIVNNSANTVSVIDTAINQVVGTAIPVGRLPRRLVSTPDGARTYVTNGNGQSVSVIATGVSITPATLPDATLNTAYSQTLTSSGGTAPYTYAVTAGTPPPGVSLTPLGELSGAPTATGTFSFTVTATDSSTPLFTGFRPYTITVAAPTITITPTTLPGGPVGAPYSQTLTASGGSGPYSYAVTMGALPPGLTLTTTGELSGTPTAGGPFSFTITATDSSAGPGPYSGPQAYSLTISAPTVALTPQTLPNATFGTAYSQTLTASGGTAPYTYTVTAGAPPPGVSLTLAGELSGVPMATGTFNFVAAATDSSTGTGPYSGDILYRLTVTKAAQTITFANPGTQTYGTPFDLAATGGTSGQPVTFVADTPAVCTVVGTRLTPARTGTCTVTASQAGDTDHDPATAVSRSFTIDAAPLTVTANNQTRPYGAPNPAFTATYAGLVNGETPATIGGTLACASAATPSSPASPPTYPITCGGLTSSNYTITYRDGALTIARAAQTITFGTPASNASYTLGDTFTVGATANSGLPVRFAAAGACALSGTTVTGTGTGTCTVTASQAGDTNYLAAPDVARTVAITAAPVPPVSQVTVTASVAGAGGTVSPAGATGYAPGSVVTYTATPASGQVFIGWTLDGQRVDFPGTLDFTVNRDRTLVATFAPRPTFSDVAPSGVQWDAITQLAARKVINGYGDGTYGPTDNVQRAQIAALLVRALGWDTERPSGPAPFSDLGAVDLELQRAILILVQRGIAKGYDDGTFDPTGEVTHAQAISLIARSMAQAGYWTPVTAAEDDGTLYPNIPATSPHRLDLLTYVKYAGGIPDRPTGQPWRDWDGPSSRAWTAQILWQALNKQFGVDRVP